MQKGRLGKRHRIHERMACDLDIVINDSIACKVFDISEGGLYARTEHSLNTGSVVKISLKINDEKVDITSKVKYCHERVGMGLMFIDMDDSLKTKIKNLIRDLQKSVKKRE
jgi:Tfp pilus assembly protein PilZ